MRRLHAWEVETVRLVCDAIEDHACQTFDRPGLVKLVLALFDGPSHDADVIEAKQALGLRLLTSGESTEGLEAYRQNPKLRMGLHNRAGQAVQFDERIRQLDGPEKLKPVDLARQPAE